MKNWLYMSTFALCLMFSQNSYAQDTAPKAPVAPTAAPTAPKAATPVAPAPAPAPKAAAPSTAPKAATPATATKPAVPAPTAPAMASQQGSCAPACPCDHPCEDQSMNDCYCLMVHYEPRHYQTQHCVEECIPCTKKCWRKVPQCYEVQKCKMVPEEYTETCTKYVNECYEVDDCKTVKKMVCVEEKVPCKKKCWRKVPQTYEVKKCKMVPQYYTETCTKYVNECYEVPDTKTCKKVVCEDHCEYVPQYYWKHVCGDQNCKNETCPNCK